MIVDGSYMAWVQPTRRVHLALSLGMTLTGVILIAAGAVGGHGAVRAAPLIGRTADSVLSRDSATPGSRIPAAPLVPFAPPPPVTPSRHPEKKPHTKHRPHPRHTVPKPAHHSGVSRPSAPSPPRPPSRPLNTDSGADEAGLG